jgi:hypothetical protein
LQQFEEGRIIGDGRKKNHLGMNKEEEGRQSVNGVFLLGSGASAADGDCIGCKHKRSRALSLLLFSFQF